MIIKYTGDNKMRYKRKEAFRYEFDKPLTALFEITDIDEKSVSTSQGEAEIIDLSPTGIKLQSKLNIPDIDLKSIRLSLTFELNDQQFIVNGLIVWKKDKGISVHYGIDLDIDKSTKQELIDQRS